MGEIFALICAVIWAIAVILLRTSVASVPPFALNLFRVVVSSLLLLVTLTALGGLVWPAATLQDYLLLTASGVIGIAVSDTLFHKALDMVGAGVVAIVDVLYTPFSIVLAWWLLGEVLTPRQWGGMALVISGIAVAATSEGRAEDVSPRQFWMGIATGVLAMFTVALGVVLAKPVVTHAPILWTTCVRQVASAIVMLIVTFFLPGRRSILAVFRPSVAWKSMLPATFLGSYLALMLWLGSMKFTKVGVSAIITQSSTIFVLILARIFLKEKFTLRKAIATALAFAGIALTV